MPHYTTNWEARLARWAAYKKAQAEKAIKTPILNEDRSRWRSCDWFAHWQTQARALPYTELRRHASVSRNNNHRCFECFCCACLTVLEDDSSQRPKA